MPITFAGYIKKIETDLKCGIATEHTYRGTFDQTIPAWSIERGLINDN